MFNNADLSEWVVPILQAAIYSLLIGGGLWKGLEAFGKIIEAVSNAFKLKAESSIERRRLEDQQIKAQYFASIEMLEKQGERIEQLQKHLSEVEVKCLERENGFRQKIDELFEKVNILETENSSLKIKYQALEIENQELLSKSEDQKRVIIYLRNRIKAIEGGKFSRKDEVSNNG